MANVLVEEDALRNIAGAIRFAESGRLFESLLARTLTSVYDSRTTSVGSCGCLDLVSAHFPNATAIGQSAFGHSSSSMGCRLLSDISFPLVTVIGDCAFGHDYGLTEAVFPKVSEIGSSAFYSCISLTMASFPEAAVIYSSAFIRCYNLVSLYLPGSSVVSLTGANAFYFTPYSRNYVQSDPYGKIYVPASLLSAYQEAENWSFYSECFVGMEEGENI